MTDECHHNYLMQYLKTSSILPSFVQARKMCTSYVLENAEKASGSFPLISPTSTTNFYHFLVPGELVVRFSFNAEM